MTTRDCSIIALLAPTAMAVGAGALAGGGLALLGLVLAIIVRTHYTVRIGSASGEANAVISKDEQYINSIVVAMNEAFIRRG